jgi:hypothetical protein
VGCIVPYFNCVIMSPADQISLTSSTPIPQITTVPMAHAPPSKLDSIHLDPELESRRPLVALSQQLLSSSDKQEKGELFLLFSLKICCSCVDHRMAHIQAFNAHIPVHISQAR